MGQLPLHPALVHVPLGLAVVLPIIALAVTFLLWRGLLSPRSFALVVLLQALTVGAGFAALRTGEADEHRFKGAAVEAHEEAATRFMIAAGGSLALGIAGLFLLRRERALRWIAAGTTAATAVVAALAISTGHAGGKLVYGSDGVAAAAQGGNDHRGGDDDDDD